MNTGSALTAHLSLFLWAVIVGLSFPVVTLLTGGLPPMMLTAVRFLTAILALAPFLYGKPGVVPGFHGFVLYLFLGGCLACFFGGMFWAANTASALSMSTLYVSVPLIAYLMGRVLRVERRDAGMFIILMVGALGAFLLAAVGEQEGGFRFGAGEAVFFAGCIASALYPVLSKIGINRGILSKAALVRTFWSLLLGSLMMGIAGFFLEEPAGLLRMTGRDILLVAYLGVFSSGVTFWLLQRATSDLTPASVTAYSYLVPFVSMVVLFAEHPEAIGWRWLPGSILVVMGIAGLLLKDTRGKVN